MPGDRIGATLGDNRPETLLEEAERLFPRSLDQLSVTSDEGCK
jgi:hypothetical protein